MSLYRGYKVNFVHILFKSYLNQIFSNTNKMCLLLLLDSSLYIKIYPMLVHILEIFHASYPGTIC